MLPKLLFQVSEYENIYNWLKVGFKF